MTCQHVALPGGGVAIICGRRMKPQRCACGAVAVLLCDWKVPRRKSGTCDKPLCERCTYHPERHGRVDHDKDLCPDHAAQWKGRLL